jgi:thioredoxin-like negative regulator of GroEL
MSNPTKPSRKEQLEAMLADDPDDALARYMLAMEHVSAGDQARAVEVFRETIARSPDYVPAYLQLGQALVRLGQTGEARSVWQRGVTEAQKQRNDHAAGEMQGMIEMLN